jgi:hypothetical protein
VPFPIYFEPLVFLDLLPEYGLLAEDFLAWVWAGAAGAGVLAGEASAVGVGFDSGASGFACLLSFSQPCLRASDGYSDVYHPEPLRIKPEAETRRRTFPLSLSSQPKPLQVFKGLAEIACMASKTAPHLSHSYS